MNIKTRHLQSLAIIAFPSFVFSCVGGDSKTDPKQVAEACIRLEVESLCPPNTTIVFDSYAQNTCESELLLDENNQYCISSGGCSIKCAINIECEGTFAVTREVVNCVTDTDVVSCLETFGDLNSICPPNTSPNVGSVGMNSCMASTEDTICVSQGECSISCDPQCEFGVKEITVDSVICNFEPACGNGICEINENPETCELDCGRQCQPDDTRCNGSELQTCDLRGFWTSVECPSGAICVQGNPSMCEFSCGNGQLDDGEDCDPAIEDEIFCDVNCTYLECGNGRLDEGEECDPRIDNSGSCETNCTFARCGNGVVGFDRNGYAEECDDGNLYNVDSCSPECKSQQPVRLLFATQDEETVQLHLYDGNIGSTIIKEFEASALGLDDFFSNSRHFWLLGYNNQAVFYINQELWITDGTTNGTTLISDDARVPYTIWNGAIYFQKNNGELWRSEGNIETNHRIDIGSRINGFDFIKNQDYLCLHHILSSDISCLNQNHDEIFNADIYSGHYRTIFNDHIFYRSCISFEGCTINAISMNDHSSRVLTNTSPGEIDDCKVISDDIILFPGANRSIQSFDQSFINTGFPGGYFDIFGANILHSGSKIFVLDTYTGLTAYDIYSPGSFGIDYYRSHDSVALGLTPDSMYRVNNRNILLQVCDTIYGSNRSCYFTLYNAIANDFKILGEEIHNLRGNHPGSIFSPLPMSDRNGVFFVNNYTDEDYNEPNSSCLAYYDLDADRLYCIYELNGNQVFVGGIGLLP